MVTLDESLGHLGAAFSFLFRGQPDQFIPELLRGAPVVGVFLLIYGLVLALCIMTFFKESDHRKYAHYFAIGIALLGTVQDSVFNIAANLIGGTMLIVILAVLFGFFIVNAWTRGKRSHLEESADMYKAKKVEQEEYRDALKQKHSSTLQGRLNKEEEHNVDQADNILRTLEHDTQDALVLFQRIQQAIQHAAGLVSQGQPFEEYKQRIASVLKTQVPRLHVKPDIAQLHEQMVKLKQTEHQQITLDHQKIMTGEHDLEQEINLIIQQLQTSYPKKVKKIKAEEENLRRLFRQAHDLIKQKTVLINEAEQLVDEGPDNVDGEAQTIAHEVDNVLSALNANDFGKASNELSLLRQKMNMTMQKAQQADQIFHKIHQLIEEIIRVDKEYERHLNVFAGKKGPKV